MASIYVDDLRKDCLCTAVSKTIDYAFRAKRPLALKKKKKKIEKGMSELVLSLERSLELPLSFPVLRQLLSSLQTRRNRKEGRWGKREKKKCGSQPKT